MNLPFRILSPMVKCQLVTENSHEQNVPNPPSQPATQKKGTSRGTTTTMMTMTMTTSPTVVSPMREEDSWTKGLPSNRGFKLTLGLWVPSLPYI
jgi:hypothetical protein